MASKPHIFLFTLKLWLLNPNKIYFTPKRKALSPQFFENRNDIAFRHGKQILQCSFKPNCVSLTNLGKYVITSLYFVKYKLRFCT